MTKQFMIITIKISVLLKWFIIVGKVIIGCLKNAEDESEDD